MKDTALSISILVVEDEPAHIEAIRRSLHAANPNAMIHIAASLREFREFVAVLTPDIALMDMNLPDGLAVEILTFPPENGPFPVVVMTGYGNEQIAVDAMKAGALDYIVKSPEMFDDMPRVVRRALREWDLLQERKYSVEALRKSEEKYRLLIDNANESVIVAQDGLIKFVNPMTIVLLGGYSEQELTDRPFPEFIHPDDRNMVVENHRRRITNEAAAPRYAFRVVARDGIVKWVELNAALIEWQGKPATLNFLTDITERKGAEEALAYEQSLLSALMNNVPDQVYFKDAHSRFIRISKAQAERFGLRDPAQAVGKTDFDFFAEDHARPAFEDEQEIMKTGRLLVGLEEQETWPDGRTGWVSTTKVPLRDRQGRVIGTFGISRDITERKRAEEELALQKRIGDIFLTVPGDEMYSEVLKIILEVMESPFGVFGYIDEAGALMVPSMTRDIWDKCQVPNKTITNLRETWGDSSGPRAVREKKPNYSNETSTKIPEGHVSLRRHISLPILYQGEVIGLFQVANKETDYRETDVRILDNIARYVAPILSARLQRRRHEEELQAKNDELTRFTYTISHDLKSPLVTIRTFLGYLEQDIRKPDVAIVDKDLAYIRNAADKVSKLLDELLELARIGRRVNPLVEVPLQEVVKEALDLVAGRIAERGVTVKVTKEPIQLFGDRLRLVEVFQNLVDNSVKFMGRQRAPRVEIGVEQIGEETMLFVRDNGIGIDPQYQPKLFGLFEKLDPGTAGTGVGLALVKRIVEVHGGRIWVESEGPDKGATFRFTLAKTTRKPA